MVQSLINILVATLNVIVKLSIHDRHIINEWEMMSEIIIYQNV